MVRAMEFVGAITTLERFSPKIYHKKTVKSYKTFENVIEMYFDISNHIKFGYFDHFVHRRKKYLPRPDSLSRFEHTMKSTQLIHVFIITQLRKIK